MSMWIKSEWRGPLVVALVEGASREAVQMSAEDVLAEALIHTPYDPTGRTAPAGTLQESGGTDVEQNREGGGQFASGWESSVFFDEPYAVPLHEHPEFEFQGAGEGKWLEKAVNKAEGEWPEMLAPPLVEVFKLP